MTHRSDRLTARLLKCSTNADDTFRNVQILAMLSDVAHTEQLYEEAKLAMYRLDIDTARVLLARCPSEFRKTRQYSEQCDLLLDLLREGVVTRPATEAMRAFLSEVLPGVDDKTLLLYSERLVNEGFGTESLRNLKLVHVDHVIECATPLCGHALALHQYAHDKSTIFEKMAYYVGKALARCGGVAGCVRAVRDVRNVISEENQNAAAEAAEAAK